MEMLPPSFPLLPVIDAREVARARQRGKILRDFVVTITQSATGRRQAVRVAARDEWASHAVAMMHTTLLADSPPGVAAVAQRTRQLEFDVRPDDDDHITPPASVPPMDVAPRTSRINWGDADPADYTGYSVVIATHPHYWTTDEGESEPIVARRRAELLADLVRNVFPGVRCDLVPGAVEKLDLSSGPDVRVRERIEAWVEGRMTEALGVK